MAMPTSIEYFLSPQHPIVIFVERSAGLALEWRSLNFFVIFVFRHQRGKLSWHLVGLVLRF